MKKKFNASFECEQALRGLGEHIRTARLRRGESESSLAERLGVSRATVARLERGDGGSSLALALEALLHYGYAEQVFALGDPDLDGVGKRLDALRRPARGRQGAGQPRRADPKSL